MQNKLVVASVLCLTLLSACVSESTIVNTDRVGKPRTDMKEAARTRMSLGLNYLQRGDTSQAKYNLEKAKQLAPDLSDVDNALAYYFQQVGELEQAEDAYRASLRKDSNNADTYNNFGSFLCQINKYKEAEELLQAAIKRPGYIRVADSYENLAFCALAQKDYTRYQQFLRQSLQHNSNRTSALYNMAVIEYAMGNLTEAKKWQTRLHQMGQVSPEATLIRYLVAYQSGDMAEQQTTEKFLLSVYPGSSEAAMLLSRDFSQSNPEQMRQAYKATLLTAPVEQGDTQKQPKMRIVKRKSAVGSSSSATMSLKSTSTANTLQTTDAVIVPAQNSAEIPFQERARDEISDLPAEAENLQTSSEVMAAMKPADPLPLEQATTVESPPVHETAATVTPPVADAGNSVTDLTTNNDGASTTSLSVSASPRKVLTHRVGAGDTLYNIASRYRLSVSELQQLNQLDDTAFIVTGQILRLSAAAEPIHNKAKRLATTTSAEEPPASYQVTDGESWFSISYKYNIKLDTLLKWNNMTTDQPLSIGQTIYLRDPASASL